MLQEKSEAADSINESAADDKIELFRTDACNAISTLLKGIWLLVCLNERLRHAYKDRPITGHRIISNGILEILESTRSPDKLLE